MRPLRFLRDCWLLIATAALVLAFLSLASRLANAQINSTTGRVYQPQATGTGSVVLATSPTLVTPTLGAATATSVNGLAITASTGTLTIANGKTLTVNNSITVAGTDATTMTFPAASATITQTIASGTAALGTGAISSGTCATVVTSTATGTATTDDIMADFNADPTSTTGYAPTSSGTLTIIKYPTSGNVNFKVCNNTGASITPGAVTLNWRVVR